MDAKEIVSVISQLGERSELTLFHVIEVPITTPLNVGTSAPDWLRDLARELKAKGIPIRVLVTEARDAAEAIVEEAEKGEYDLIIMFKRKRKGLGKVVGRSVSERVSRMTRRPVMTILR